VKPIRIIAVLCIAAVVGCGQEGAKNLASSAAPTSSAAATRAPATSQPPAAPAATAARASVAPTRTPAPPLTEAQLRRSLFTTADLPGWTAVPDDSNGSGGEGGPDFEPPCAGDIQPNDLYSAEVTADFQRSEAGPFITHVVDGYKTAAIASHDLDLFVKVIKTCPTWEETDSDGVKYTMRASLLTLPKIGDETVGARIDLTFTSNEGGTPVTGKGQINITGSRVGRQITGVLQVALGFFDDPYIDPADTEKYARKAVAKLAGLV
jgi:hypothetical protein